MQKEQKHIIFLDRLIGKNCVNDRNIKRIQIIIAFYNFTKVNKKKHSPSFLEEIRHSPTLLIDVLQYRNLR